MNSKQVFSLSLTVLLLFVFKLTEAQVVTLFAGNYTTNGYGGDGGPATSSTCFLHSPYAIAHDALGNFYFTEYENYIVRKVSNTGIITTIAGTGSPDMGITPIPTGVPATSVNLGSPYGIAVDATGNVYFSAGAWIWKISTTGILTKIAGTGNLGYSGDGGAATAADIESGYMDFDALGNLFISQYGSNVVRKITPSGIISTVAGQGPSMGGYGGDGGPATAALLTAPRDVKFDDAGNLYILDGSGVGVRKVNTSGVISTVAGNLAIGLGFAGDGGPATNARMNNATQIAVDGPGNIYISDLGNQRIRKVSTAGIISTFVGTGSWIWNGLGLSGTSTNLWGPMGLDIYGGKLYFCEAGNSVIRKIDGLTTSVEDKVAASDFVVSGDDAKGDIIVRLSTPSTTVMDLSIADITGRSIIQQGLTTNSDISIHIDTPPGLYFVTAYTSEGRWSKKVFIN